MAVDLDLLSVPLAAVAGNWLTAEFLPSLDTVISGDLCHGGVVWLPVDSSSESDYLIAQIAHHKDRWRRPLHELRVSEWDPLLFWLQLTGSGDTGGGIGSISASIMLVASGEYLPTASLELHITTLESLCRAVGAVFVMPVFRLALIGSSLSEIGSRISVPSFTSSEIDRLTSLVETLAHERLPSLSDPERGFVVSHILAAGPTCRAQVEHWLNEYAQSDDPLNAIQDRPLPLPLGPLSVPPSVPVRTLLDQRFRNTRSRLDAADLAMQSIFGKQLVFRHQPLTSPFESSDPSYWFMCLVSHLSCLMFDAGEKGLLIIARRSYDRVRGDISGNPCSILPEELRKLRTSMQHGMDMDNSRNQRILESVAVWYQQQIGTTAPTPEHARCLSAKLLDMWEAFVDGVYEVVTNLRRAPSAASVMGQIEMEMGGIASGDFLRILDDSISKMGACVNKDRIKKRYEEKVRARIRDSCLLGEAAERYARELIENCIAEESCLCPVDPDWLTARGIFKGDEMGVLLGVFRAKWNASRGRVTAEEFTIEAEKDLPSMRWNRGTRGNAELCDAENTSYKETRP